MNRIQIIKQIREYDHITYPLVEAVKKADEIIAEIGDPKKFTKKSITDTVRKMIPGITIARAKIITKYLC